MPQVLMCVKILRDTSLKVVFSCLINECIRRSFTAFIRLMTNTNITNARVPQHTASVQFLFLIYTNYTESKHGSSML